MAWPSRLWTHLHMDFAGSVEGRYILIIVDAHSKWSEATCAPSTSSSALIEMLQLLFTRFGLPESMVTDNGTGFVSKEFGEFLRSNGCEGLRLADGRLRSAELLQGLEVCL